MTKDLLIIFAKNPAFGEVKTRLAKTVGEEAAFTVYKQLLKTTEKATSKLNVTRHIYFSNKIATSYWKKDPKMIQEGKDLGERMCNAFKNSFQNGYERIVLIGTDLPEISEELLSTAFTKLNETEVVFGPSEDGGYYLVGMTNMHQCIFTDKPWSTTKLLEETLAELQQKNVGVSITQTLNDIDTFEDLKQYPDYLKLI